MKFQFLKKHTITTILLLYIFKFVSCNKANTQKIKADLTFRSISFASAYGANEYEYNVLIKTMDSVLKDKINNRIEEVKRYEKFLKLKSHNLLRSPYIFLHLDKNSVITVYLSDKEYEKIKHIKHSDLLKENKKIVLELEIEKKDNTTYYSKKIIKINKVIGMSRSNMF